MEIKIGDRFVITGNHRENGNIIEITGVSKIFRCYQPTTRYFYKTIAGSEPDNYFDQDSWFAGILIPYASKSQKVVITTDGVTTLARLFDGKQVIRSAEARCAPGDTFDFAVGANLAYDRLMERSLLTVQSLLRKTSELLGKESDQ